MRLLYSLAIRCYSGAIRLAALFNGKARYWVEGRQNWAQNLTEKIGSSDKVFWIHSASLGEYEQAIPVIKALKSNFPTYKVLLTFFSPSGFRNFKGSPYVDFVTYLPADTRANARKFLEIARPSAIFLVKYEIWHNYIWRAYHQKIPL